MIKKRELVIVGGGPAGMAAALAAYKYGIRDILLLERNRCLGGMLNQCIHTGFGLEYFNTILTGPEYADRFIDKVCKIDEIAVRTGAFVADLTCDKILTVMQEGRFERIKARSLIMATGCRERTREMVHVAGDRPAGVFSAGFAQQLINAEGLLPGRDAVIVGSGDIGMIMARRLVLEGMTVKGIVEVEGHSRGLVRNFVQCVKDFDIPLYFRHKVLAIKGRDRVEKVFLCKIDDRQREIPSTEFEISCDTVLFSVGLIPENELIEKAGVAMDRDTNTPDSTEAGRTSIAGVFVCGNCCKIYDLVDAVTRDSERVARICAEYLGYPV
jgi:NADPH-dependent 2,4-dienoyl-CoA reductase/sulfur reductase-like enzyme